MLPPAAVRKNYPPHMGKLPNVPHRTLRFLFIGYDSRIAGSSGSPDATWTQSESRTFCEVDRLENACRHGTHGVHVN
jgi:hypothetical protein